MEPAIPQHDADILRRLAARIMEMAHSPENLERKKAWYAHDEGLANRRPMVLAEICGVTNEVFPPSMILTKNPYAKEAEWGMRSIMYEFEVLKDDHVVEPYFNQGWWTFASDYGVQVVEHKPETGGTLGAKRWDPPIKDLDADFNKLKHRTFRVDRPGIAEQKERLENAFGDILPVRIHGSHYWTMGLTGTAIRLVGLDNLMLYMYDNPAGLHRLMSFLRDDHLAFGEWLEKEGLFTLNNGNDYTGSGSMGYTHSLPQKDWKQGGAVRRKDLWVLSESQETVGVGPDQFDEFIFPYQESIAKLYGKCYYGCCEPLHSRIHILKRLPNLARVSVSPWADEEKMAEACGMAIAYSRKPSPTLISTDRFDEHAIRADICTTLEKAKGCRVELIMKDVHTLKNQPQRLARWVEIAREEIEKKL